MRSSAPRVRPVEDPVPVRLIVEEGKDSGRYKICSAPNTETQKQFVRTRATGDGRREEGAASRNTLSHIFWKSLS